MRSPFVLLLIVSVFAITQSTVVEFEGSEVFASRPTDISVNEGEKTILSCIAGKNVPINKCQWTWKNEDENSTEELKVHEFTAFGDENRDCSMILANVTLSHQGYWSCMFILENKTVFTSPSALMRVQNRIKFVQTPRNVTTTETEKVTLTCATHDFIEDCLWLYRIPNTLETVQVSVFKPIKNNCSLTINSVKKVHLGYWLCGVRRRPEDEYFYSDEAHLLVIEKEVSVKFAETPVDTVFSVGSNGSIRCKTNEEIQKCRWFWQPQGYSEEWRVLMKEFPPEDDRDCSLHFKDMTTEPEGIWMCSVLPYNITKYFRTKPVTLHIKTLMEFSVLTRAVVVAEGMETSLRCQTDADVVECRWRWHQLGEANAPSLVVKKFAPFGPSSQDCSIQFTNMLMEQQGVWVCGVRLRNETDFTEAMPTTVSLKPAGRVRILDIAQPVTIAEKEYLLLACISSASVNDCQWEFSPVNIDNKPFVIHFPPSNNASRNCSLKIASVEMKHDGMWKCSVEAKREKGSVKATSGPIRVTVIKPVDVKFENVATVIHASPGSSGQLPCQVSNEVDMCRWIFHGPPDVIKAEFPPLNGTDCTLNLSDLQVFNSGAWQCGIKNIGQYHYRWAPLTTLNVLHTENISTSYWISDVTNQLSLACHLKTQLPLSIINCHWIQHSKINMSALNNDRKSYIDYFDETNGDCLLEFHPHLSDPGIWQCLYTVKTENGTWKLGEAKFVILTNLNNLRLRLIVGILAATTVIMAIVLGVVIVYGCPQTTVKAQGKLKKNNDIAPSVLKKESVRYTDETGKIMFHFSDTPKLVVDLPLSSPSASLTHSPPPNHVYERVGQYVSPSSVNGIYQNMK